MLARGHERAFDQATSYETYCFAVCQKATRSTECEWSDLRIQVAGLRELRKQRSNPKSFYSLVEAVTLPWRFSVKVRSSGCADGRTRTRTQRKYPVPAQKSRGKTSAPGSVTLHPGSVRGSLAFLIKAGFPAVNQC